MKNEVFSAHIQNCQNILHFALHVHRKNNCYSEPFFFILSERTLSKTLRHLQSFLVAFNEQVQNIGKSKASTAEVV